MDLKNTLKTLRDLKARQDSGQSHTNESVPHRNERITRQSRKRSAWARGRILLGLARLLPESKERDATVAVIVDAVKFVDMQLRVLDQHGFTKIEHRLVEAESIAEEAIAEAMGFGRMPGQEFTFTATDLPPSAPVMEVEAPPQKSLTQTIEYGAILERSFTGKVLRQEPNRIVFVDGEGNRFSDSEGKLPLPSLEDAGAKNDQQQEGAAA